MEINLKSYFISMSIQINLVIFLRIRGYRCFLFKEYVFEVIMCNVCAIWSKKEINS